MTAQFNIYSDTEFLLNGILFDKVFLALPKGSNSIQVVCVYESKNVIMNTTLVSEITVEGVTYATQALLIAALKPLLYSHEGSGSGGTGGVGGYQGTKIHYLNLTGVDTDASELSYIAAAINANGAYTCETGQQMQFRTSIQERSDQQNVVIRLYRLLPNLTSVGGVAGYQVNTSDLMPDGRMYVNYDDNQDLFIDLGDIAAATIQDAFNADAGVPHTILGEQFVVAVQSGVDKIFRFTGGNGNWGTGYLVAVAGDFDDLSAQPEVIIAFEGVTVTADTGTTILLDNIHGNLCNMASASVVETFTTISISQLVGGHASVLCNAAAWTDWAVVTGGNFINDLGTFASQTATVFELIVWFDGVQVNYIFRPR